MAPFHIIGSVQYVGTGELGAYLITGPQGHVLIDGGAPSTAPQLLESIATLGFKVTDIKWLLTTQAHQDHVGSLAALQIASGARVAVMAGDAELVERGGHEDFAFGDTLTFPAVHVDRVLHDGDVVSVGDTVLTAHLTAGHTRGCTTWTMATREGDRTYRVVFAGSLTVNPPVRLWKNPSYPGILEDYRRSVATMRALPIDVFLGSHAGFFDLVGKRDRLARGASPNPFIDPAGFAAMVDRGARALEQRVKSEKSR
jgi:metallo-beta-lactamase class B